MSAADEMMLRAVWLIVRKDLTVEVRSRELAYTTLFFAVSCVLVFAFSLVQEGRAAEGVGAGRAVDGDHVRRNLALGRTFERERQSETLRALMLVPAPRPAVYLGKLVGIVVLLALTEAVLVPLVALLFQAELLAHPVLAGGDRGHRDARVCGRRDAVCRDARARPQPRRAAAGVAVSDHRSGLIAGVRGTVAMRSRTSTRRSCGSGSRCWSRSTSCSSRSRCGRSSRS